MLFLGISLAAPLPLIGGGGDEIPVDKGRRIEAEVGGKKESAAVESTDGEDLALRLKKMEPTYISLREKEDEGKDLTVEERRQILEYELLDLEQRIRELEAKVKKGDPEREDKIRLFEARRDRDRRLEELRKITAAEEAPSEPEKESAPELSPEMRSLLEKGKKEGLTNKEYQKLIKIQREEEGGWRIREIDGTRLWHPKRSNREDREEMARSWREANAAKQKIINEELRLRQAEMADYKRAHGGKDHSPCECYQLQARPAYMGSLNEAFDEETPATSHYNIAIASTNSKNPTKLPRKQKRGGNTETLVAIEGRGEKVSGKFTYKSGLNCCEGDHIERNVYIAISFPDGTNGVPRYEGIECPKEGNRRDNIPGWSIRHELELNRKLSWTPNDYDGIHGIKMSLGGPVSISTTKKEGVWVREPILLLNKRTAHRGPGKIDLIVDGEVCIQQTVYFEYVCK